MQKLKVSFGVIVATRNIFNFRLAVDAHDAKDGGGDDGAEAGEDEFRHFGSPWKHGWGWAAQTRPACCWTKRR